MLEIKDYALPSPDQWRIVIKGMRNAYKSWKNSDSYLHETCVWLDINGNETEEIDLSLDLVSERGSICFYLGPKDANLLKSLTKLGSSDRKVLRQLPVTLEIKAPLKWWDQMDQYKIGTVTNSTSQMHTLLKKEFSCDDFSANPYQIEPVVKELNRLRELYLERDNPEKKRSTWRFILDLIPQSFNYTRTWSANYEVLLTIYFQRKGHDLVEWETFRNWCLENVPYFKELVEVIESGLS